MLIRTTLKANLYFTKSLTMYFSASSQPPNRKITERKVLVGQVGPNISRSQAYKCATTQVQLMISCIWRCHNRKYLFKVQSMVVQMTRKVKHETELYCSHVLYFLGCNSPMQSLRIHEEIVPVSPRRPKEWNYSYSRAYHQHFDDP